MGLSALDAVAGWPVGAAQVEVWRRIGDGAQRVDGVGDSTAVAPWASVTKLLVALATLVAVEEGTLALDEPAGPPGSTVAHLLAHASGLGREAEDPVESPGRHRRYSNVGFEVLAATVATRTDMAFGEYLTLGVLDPLGMAATHLAEAASPAWGATGPVGDLGRLAGELLAPRLVSPETVGRARQVAFPGLSGVVPGVGWFERCDWGLGFELRDGKRPHWTGARNSPETFGHFGRSGSFCWVDPVAEVACVGLADRPFGRWALEAWPALADAVLAELAG